MKNLIILIFIISSQIALCQWESIITDLGNTAFQDFVIFDSKIYGASSTGIYSSSNNGVNWTKLNNGLELKSNTFPVYINLIDTTLFTAVLRSYRDGFIYKSADYGANWLKIDPIKEMPFACLEVSGTNLITSRWVFGTFFSSDLGMSWDTLKTDFTKKPINNLWATGEYLFVYSTEGGFLSTDKGTSWNRIDTSSIFGYFGAFTYNNNHLFISSYDNIYCSTDNGLSWSKKKLPVIPNMYGPIMDFAFTGNIMFAGGGYLLYVSTDFGESWYESNGVPNIRSLAINDGYLFAAAMDGFSSRAKISDLLAAVDVEEVPKIGLKSSINISPNPSSNHIKIGLSDVLGRIVNGKIEISSNIGEKLLNMQINEGIYSQGIDLDVSAYPSGMYFCTVRTSSYVETQPFLVIH
jgi:photosystem II stability/assembly factor-like uncharacterized protein